MIFTEKTCGLLAGAPKDVTLPKFCGGNFVNSHKTLKFMGLLPQKFPAIRLPMGVGHWVVG